MANFFDDIISGTAFGQRQQRTRESRQRIDLRQLDADIERMLRTADPQKRANMQALIDKSSLFDKTNKLAAEQGDVPFQQARQDPKEQADLALVYMRMAALTEDKEKKETFSSAAQDLVTIASDRQGPIDRGIAAAGGLGRKGPGLAKVAPQVKDLFLGDVGPTAARQPVDNRALLTQGGVAFDQLPTAKEKSASSRKIFDPPRIRDVASFLQTRTPASETDNVPKTRDQIGAGQNRQMSAQYEEVQNFVQDAQERGKLDRDFVLQQSFQNNPADFQLLFKAMRDGVPDGKGGTRKMTKAEWLKALQGMGR